jgi:hypothetical protein
MRLFVWLYRMGLRRGPHRLDVRYVDEALDVARARVAAAGGAWPRLGRGRTDQGDLWRAGGVPM